MSVNVPQFSAEAYPLALEVGAIGVWEWNIDTGDAVWSPVFAKLLGVPLQDLPTSFQASLDMTHPADRPVLMKVVDLLLTGSATRRMEYRVRHGDGGWRQLRGSACAVFDDSGEPVRVVLAAVDVTTQDQAMQAAALRHRLEEVAHQSAAALIAATIGEIDDVVTEALGRFAGLLGAQRAALVVGDPRLSDAHEHFAWPRTIPHTTDFRSLEAATLAWLLDGSEDRADVRTAHREELPEAAVAVRDGMAELGLDRLLVVPSAVAGQTAALQFQAVGTTRWSREGDGILRAFADACIQALARARLEAGVEEARRHLQHLVDRSPLIMWRLDAGSDALSYLSQNTLQILGVEAEVMAETWTDWVHPDDLPAMAETMAEVRGGAESGTELRFRHADGHWVPLEIVVRPDEPGDGGPLGAVGYSMDISERRAMESSLRRADKLEAVGQLAAGVAHDFNNLLTVMHGYMELAQGGDLDALDEALRASEAARALVDRLLTFSRHQDADAASVDLNGVLHSLEATIRSAGAGTDVRFDLASGLPPVLADVGQLEQAVLNLVDNARDAMPGGGTLIVRTDLALSGDLPDKLDAAGTWVRLQVQDDGAGMVPDVEARAFEPFFTTKTRGHGNGLGLPAVHGTVTSAGGALRLDTEPGVGTTVHLFLQAAGEAPEPVREASTAATVLLVEDQPQIGDLVRNVLARAGYEVLVASDGKTALALAQDRRLDLLLTDVALPHLSGPQVAEALRRTQPGLPVLYMSGFSGDALGDDEHAAFLQKPFRIAQLVQATAAAIRRGGHRP